MEPSLYKSKGLLFWIRAARLRTLPLSVSGILAGSGWGVTQGVFQWPIFFSALLTTIFFQVLSNFANDYGDGVKGTDQQGRVGPERLLQHSDAAKSTLKWVLVAFAVLSIASAALTLYLSFGWERQYWLIFMGLTAASIAAAIGYTVGKHAYGYLGLGDIFVFVFFGMLGVWGSAFLYAKIWDPYSLWPLVWVIGMGSVGVLNLNNMRCTKRCFERKENLGGSIRSSLYALVPLVSDHFYRFSHPLLDRCSIPELDPVFFVYSPVFLR